MEMKMDAGLTAGTLLRITGTFGKDHRNFAKDHRAYKYDTAFYTRILLQSLSPTKSSWAELFTTPVIHTQNTKPNHYFLKSKTINLINTFPCLDCLLVVPSITLPWSQNVKKRSGPNWTLCHSINNRKFESQVMPCVNRRLTSCVYLSLRINKRWQVKHTLGIILHASLRTRKKMGFGNKMPTKLFILPTPCGQY